MKSQDEEVEEPVAEVASPSTSTSTLEQPPSSPVHQRHIESVRYSKFNLLCKYYVGMYMIKYYNYLQLI